MLAEPDLQHIVNSDAATAMQSYPSMYQQLVYRCVAASRALQGTPPGSLNRVPALISSGKGGNVTSAGWQVTLCDLIWHVSSHSGAMLVAQTAICFLTLH